VPSEAGVRRALNLEHRLVEGDGPVSPGIPNRRLQPQFGGGCASRRPSDQLRSSVWRVLSPRRARRHPTAPTASRPPPALIGHITEEAGMASCRRQYGRGAPLAPLGAAASKLRAFLLSARADSRTFRAHSRCCSTSQGTPLHSNRHANARVNVAAKYQSSTASSPVYCRRDRHRLRICARDSAR